LVQPHFLPLQRCKHPPSRSRQEDCSVIPSLWPKRPRHPLSRLGLPPSMWGKSGGLPSLLSLRTGMAGSTKDLPWSKEASRPSPLRHMDTEEIRTTALAMSPIYRKETEYFPHLPTSFGQARRSTNLESLRRSHPQDCLRGGSPRNPHLPCHHEDLPNSNNNWVGRPQTNRSRLPSPPFPPSQMELQRPQDRGRLQWTRAE